MKTAKPTLQNSVTVSLSALIKLRWQAATIDLTSDKRVTTQLSGSYLSGFRGRGVELMEVRNYQQGDDIRHMDWRVTARTGRPHTKIYHEERERPVFVFVDYRPSMFFGTRVAFKSTIATRAAALIIWAAIRHGDRVGGFVFTENQTRELPPRGRQQGALLLLKMLADASQLTNAASTQSLSLAKAIAKLRRIVKPGSLVFMFSDFHDFDKEAELQLGQLVQHSEVVTGFIYDSIEQQPPPPNCYAVTDGIQTLLIDTRSTAYCQEYRTRFDAHLRHLQQSLQKYRISLLQLATHNPVAETLQQQLRACFYR